MLSRFVFVVISLLILSTFATLLSSCGDDNPSAPNPDGPPGNAVDTIPPAAVRGMVAKSPTSMAITLQWVSPGDDGMNGQASRYDIRYSSTLITEQNWGEATSVPDSLVPKPKPADNLEKCVVKGLPSAQDVYFALKTYDEASNESGLSNCPMATTQSEFRPPAAVMDLVAYATADGEFLLTWTAPGDDGAVSGTASQYDVRYSVNPITEENFNTLPQVKGAPQPSPLGQPESLLVAGLLADMDYHFALKTADEVPNWSGLSRVAPGLAFNHLMMVYPRHVFVGETKELLVAFRLDAPERVAITISRLVWNQWPWRLYVFRHLVDDEYQAGSHTESWDLTGDDGNPVDASFGQIEVRLQIGNAPAVDSVSVQILEP